MSAVLVVPMILGMNLGQIASTAAVAVLLIQGFTHVGHLRLRRQTRANAFLVALAVLGTFVAAGFATYHTTKGFPLFPVYLAGGFAAAFLVELLLRATTHRTILRQIVEEIEELGEKAEEVIEDILD